MATPGQKTVSVVFTILGLGAPGLLMMLFGSKYGKDALLIAGAILFGSGFICVAIFSQDHRSDQPGN